MKPWGAMPTFLYIIHILVTRVVTVAQKLHHAAAVSLVSEM